MNTPAGGVTLPELLPCPFCGLVPEGPYFVTGMSFHWTISCGPCKFKVERYAKTGTSTNDPAKQEVITAWNTRTALAGEWRDASESLPDYEGADEVRQHLVYHPACFGLRIVTEHPSWWNRKDPRGREFDGEKVSHWMPLPAAPLPKEPGR